MQLPTNTELGMLLLDSRTVRTKLLPTPKEQIAKIEDLVPKVLKTRVDDAKRWLQTNIKNLSQKVATVEDFVTQNNDLNYANEHF